MSVKDCLTKLVATGKITRAMADEASALFERSKGEYSRTMGPASAEAAAALETARSLEAGAKRLKNSAEKQAMGYARAERRMAEHKKGKVAGVMSQLVRDIWGLGGENVFAKSSVIFDSLAAKFEEGLAAYKPGVLGQSAEQIQSVRNFIREGFGVDTGDATAKKAWAGWKTSVVEGVDRIRAAGRNLMPNEDWRFAQHWTPERVRRFGKDAYKQFWTEQVDRGTVTLWDRDTGKPVPAADRDRILDRAYRDIVGGGGDTGTFARESRTFQFTEGEAGAKAWLDANDKFGSGDNIIGHQISHLSRMAREIALAEVIGPNHGAIIRALMKQAKEAEGELTKWQRLNPVRGLEHAGLIERTYDVLTGKADQVEGPLLSGFFGGLRSIATAAQLKGAIISSVPSDSVNAAFAANHVGMPVSRLIEGVTRELARGGKDSRVLAARLHLTAHSAAEFSHGFRFFPDQMGGPESLKFVATAMIRAQGLQAWTELIKRTFTMEMMGHLADHARFGLAKIHEVNPALGRFLDTYGISAKEWDAIRQSNKLTVEGATFLDTGSIADRALREKLLGAVVEERAFAMLEPDARIRAVTTGAAKQGTLVGEINRSLFLFKSFAVTMAATHVMRIATQGPIHSRIWNGLAFTTFSTLAGAMSLQAKNVVYGKDPENMRTGTFWGKSFLQGGAFGIYGDLLNSSFSRSGRSPLADVAGPIGGMAEDAIKLSFAQSRKWYEGADTTVGAEAVRTARRYMPGTFYTKTVADRLLFDQIQMLADPDYRGSFRRMEQRLKNDTGQQFWWGPGDRAPERAPNLGAAVR